MGRGGTEESGGEDDDFEGGPIDDEAGVSEPEGSREEDEDEDEEEEGPDEYEKDGFLVDEEEEDEAAESDEEAKRKKKKKKRKKEVELDEEDLELLEENDVNFHRPVRKGDNRLKRLKKAGRPESRQGGEDDEEGEEGARHRSTHTAEELKETLFGGPELEEDEREAPPDELDEDDFDEEEGDDFIDDNERDEHGRIIRRGKQRKRVMDMGIESDALSQYQQIFGDPTELLERRQQALAAETAAEADEEEELDEEGMPVLHGLGKKKLAEMFEPEILSERYMTDDDERIRQLDVPERLQLLQREVGPFPDKEDTTQEATWIYNRAFHRSGRREYESRDLRDWLPVDERRFEYVARVDRDEVVHQIASVLTRIHDDKFEVPFIGLYRREQCQDLVCSVFGDSRDRERDRDRDRERDRGRDWDRDRDHYRDGREEKEAKWTSPLAKMDALWEVLLWDQKWLQLQRRKELLLRLMRAELEEEEEGSEQASVISELIKQAKDVLTKEERSSERFADSQMLDAVESHFRLLFGDAPAVAAADAELKLAAPKKRSAYATLRRAGLEGLKRIMVLSARDYGQHLQAMYKMKDPENPTVTPEEAAADFECPECPNTEAILKGARIMAAAELATLPQLRKYVWSEFLVHGAVSTRPTMLGEEAIDPLHRYAGVKWLRQKPLLAFRQADWLLIEKAEEDGLLAVSIEFAPERLETILKEELGQMYMSEGVSALAQQWNAQRQQVLDDAVRQRILPLLVKEARKALASRAKHYLKLVLGDRLWDIASVAPWVAGGSQPRRHRHEYEGARVMAVCWGGGDPATTAVMLDEHGDLLDFLHIGFLLARDGIGEEMEMRKDKDQQRLLDMIMDHKPHVIVVGACNLQCQRLSDEVFKLVHKLVEDYPRYMAGEQLPCEFADEQVARLYEKSRAAEDQFPGVPGIVRRAIGVGRGFQNPLAMIASLCGPRSEVLSLSLHPMQELLPRDVRRQVVDELLTTLTAQVGFDVNEAIAHEWLFTLLPFVPGLGPRKALALEQKLRTAGRVSSRKELYEPPISMTKKIFINAAGTLRVRASGAMLSEEELDALDDTRVHPEAYRYALQMIEDCLRILLGHEPDDMEMEAGIETVRKSPDVLDELDLDKFMEELDMRGMTPRQSLLELVRDELKAGFAEWRAPRLPPSETQKFFMLSGETEETLCQGRIVQATVRRIKPLDADPDDGGSWPGGGWGRRRGTEIICSLESGLTVYVAPGHFSDDNLDPAKHISEGAVISGRIMQIDFGRTRVEVTCGERDLQDKEGKWRLMQPYSDDRFYSFQWARPVGWKGEAREKEAKEEAVGAEGAPRRRQPFLQRMIVHPSFQNVTGEEAEELLVPKDIGAFLIRPSSKGPTHLSLSLKFAEGVVMHVDMEEEGKDPKDVASLHRVGKRLVIRGTGYEDLDEVVARFVEPLVANITQMQEYRKFHPGTRAEVDDALRLARTQKASVVAYHISVAHKHPGAFLLSYIRSMEPHHEYITVTPSGFRFRKESFNSPDKLIRYFQQNINDKLPAPPQRAAAASVPYHGPGNPDWGNPDWGHRGQQAPPRGPPFSHHSGWDQGGHGTWHDGPGGAAGGWPGPQAGAPGGWNSQHGGAGGGWQGSYHDPRWVVPPSAHGRGTYNGH